MKQRKKPVKRKAQPKVKASGVPSPFASTKEYIDHLIRAVDSREEDIAGLNEEAVRMGDQLHDSANRVVQLEDALRSTARLAQEQINLLLPAARAEILNRLAHEMVTAMPEGVKLPSGFYWTILFNPTRAIQTLWAAVAVEFSQLFVNILFEVMPNLSRATVVAKDPQESRPKATTIHREPTERRFGGGFNAHGE